MGRKTIAICSLFALYWGVGASGTALAVGEIDEVQYSRKPSNLQSITSDPQTETIYISCYGYYGAHRFPLNCPFTLWIDRARAGGLLSDKKRMSGHEHSNSSRPILYRKRQVVNREVRYEGTQNPLRFKGDQLPAEPGRVAGQTDPDDQPRERAIVEWDRSEVSGGTELNVQIESPDGWFCSGTCYTRTMSWTRNFIHLAVDGIAQLPEPGPNDDYRLVRSPDTRHLDKNAFGVREEHISDIKKLATIYADSFESDRVLSLNDASLPYGGLFDISGDWSPPHKSHRAGDAVDINQVGIPCTEDDALIRATKEVFRNTDRGYANSAVLCELGGRKHLYLSSQGG